MPDRVDSPWGERTPYGRGDEWPARVDGHTVADAECVSLCHPETLRIVRWTVTKLKEAAPQVLTV